MYTNAKYKKDSDGNVFGIQVDKGNSTWSVPLDPANTDYQRIMALVKEGKLVIAPAEGAA